MYEQQLGRELHRLSIVCTEQYLAATRLLEQYVRTKGASFNGDSLISKGREVIAMIDPQEYFNTFQSLLSIEKAPRIIAALMDVLYNVRIGLQRVQQLLEHFTTTYEEANKTYYSNIADFQKLNEELKEYIRGKTLNKQAADWVQGYFAIFDQWLRNGAGKDMSVLQQEIVQKIPELNRNQPGSPFGSRTNEKAFQCQIAYDTVSQLDDDLIKKLQQYIYAGKRMAKVTGLLATDLLSTAPPVPGEPKTARKEKLLAITGLLLVAALCFWGGRYTGNLRQASIAGNTMPVTVKNETGDTATHAAPLVVDQNIISHNELPVDTLQVVCGLDISKYQGNLLNELNQLDTMHFVICKATQGTTLVDVDFTYNWKRLQQLKLVRGAYHFYMAKDDPVQQAQHFLKTVGVLAKNDIPLIIDIEEGSITGKPDKKQLQYNLLTCLKYLYTHSGKKPVIYTDLSFANMYLQQPALAGFPLWLAEYSHRSAPVLPVTWKEKGIVFWQKNDTLTINSRKTDFDVFVGNGHEFTAFLKGE